MSRPATQAERDQRFNEIKSQRARGMTFADIAWQHDISQARIGQILSREQRRQIGQIENDLQDIEWMLIDRLIGLSSIRERHLNSLASNIVLLKPE